MLRLPPVEKTSVHLRRLLLPDWLWQLTWLRRIPQYWRMIDWKECPLPRWRVLCDLLYIFFRLRAAPEHYPLCRLWEVPRSEWSKYFGIPYTPIQRGRLARKVYPVEYQILYNDKVVASRLQQSLGLRVPRILGTVEPEPTGAWRETIARWLKTPGSRAILKPIFGRSGIGIAMAERTAANEGVVVHTQERDLPLEEFDLPWPLLAQELVQQHERIAAIWNSSVNTCRIVTMLTARGDVIILGCTMRFGVGNSFVDNWCAGGIAVGIDHRTGRLRQYAHDMHCRRYTAHPSSGVVFEGFEIPHWDRLLETAKKIQREIPFSRISGCDLCIDASGEIAVIEVNGLPDLTLQEQTNGPLLAHREVLEAFAAYDLLVCKAQRNLLPMTAVAPAYVAPVRRATAAQPAAQ